MFDWVPDQNSLYIATSTRHKNWKEIVAFPQIKQYGNKTLLSFVKELPHNTQVQDSEFKSVKGRLTLPPQKGSEGKLTQA